MPTPVLQSLFAAKAWANAELFAMLQSQPDQTHAAALHTATRTLNHIHVVDEIFQAHLLGQAPTHATTNTAETPSLATLGARVAATDAWYVQHVASLDATRLAEQLDFSFTDGDAGRMSREEVLMHVISHGAYHRGNVGQVLKSIGLTPPRDLYTKYLHQAEPEQRRRGAPA
jgi:uncharacterized damage-inducible protein DinB